VPVKPAQRQDRTPFGPFGDELELARQLLEALAPFPEARLAAANLFRRRRQEQGEVIDQRPALQAKGF
jgi:hypothetical protein